MTYALLIFQGATPLPGTEAWERLDTSEQEQIYADYAAINSTDGVTPGPPLGLPASARTVRVRDGRPRVDAEPYASLDDSVAGLLIVETDDESEALALAARVPAARLGGAIEVRRVERYW